MQSRYFSVIRYISPLAAIVLAACAAAAPTVTNPFDEKVDVGGYALQIRCRGQGLPSVIVETGFGEPGVEKENSSWLNVAGEIEKTTRICLYDRAGLGSSDVAPGEKRTSQDVANDLHTLLANAHVPGPYILVAHSLGGFHALVFASRFADEVAGLVLVDSSHPDQWQTINAVLPPEAPADPEGLRRLRAIPPASLPEKLDIPASLAQVRAVKSLGSLPLVVLSHSHTLPIDPDLPPELARKIEQVWEQKQNELAGLSTASTHLVAEKSGHYIQVDEPQIVIDAVLNVLEQTKARK